MFYYLIDLHYSQTLFRSVFLIFSVLLPYRFTLFSNSVKISAFEIEVLLPYRFTLFSNCPSILGLQDLFYYLIDLHYSQTTRVRRRDLLLFYYLIDLHYSQTLPILCSMRFLFYYLIDLHYSQTFVKLNTDKISFTTL